MALATLTDGTTTVTFGYTLWIDEDDWTPIPQSIVKSIDGSLIREILPGYDSGRPITLRCEFEGQYKLDQLRTLRDRVSQTDMTLTLEDARVFTVGFRHHEGPPVNSTPLNPRPDMTEEGVLYDILINLMEV